MPQIHPAPAEFSAAQLTTDPILRFFHYHPLPAALQSISQPFCRLAGILITTLPRNAERTVSLRKLLEAKDAAVRANLPALAFGDDSKPSRAVGPQLGEPTEVGGHDVDRDGPIPFGDGVKRMD